MHEEDIELEVEEMIQIALESGEMMTCEEEIEEWLLDQTAEADW